jgi:hypothetical protein
LIFNNIKNIVCFGDLVQVNSYGAAGEQVSKPLPQNLLKKQNLRKSKEKGKDTINRSFIRHL